MLQGVPSGNIMKYSADLHIHSALSPCADNEMTPNNIVNMALLKGLDIIAVTDHNSAANIQALLKCAEGTGLLVVPGMELMTSEEVHIVCLFPDAESALQMQDKVYEALPGLKNREEIFGQQLLIDENDSITGSVNQLLITAAAINLEEASDLVEGYGGAVIPAHIDRNSFSLISNLGMIPEKPVYKYLELSRNCDMYEYRLKNPQLDKYKFICSSDAHVLGDILEREAFIDLEQLSIECLLKKFTP